jgi:hypothetical protein
LFGNAKGVGNELVLQFEMMDDNVKDLPGRKFEKMFIALSQAHFEDAKVACRIIKYA